MFLHCTMLSLRAVLVSQRRGERKKYFTEERDFYTRLKSGKSMQWYRRYRRVRNLPLYLFFEQQTLLARICISLWYAPSNTAQNKMMKIFFYDVHCILVFVFPLFIHHAFIHTNARKRYAAGIYCVFALDAKVSRVSLIWLLYLISTCFDKSKIPAFHILLSVFN